MMCPNCNSQITDDSRYCARCGQPVPFVSNTGPAGTTGRQPNPALFQSGRLAADQIAAAPPAGVSLETLSLDPTNLSASSSSEGLEASPNIESLHARLAQANLCRLRRQWSEAIDHCVAVLRAQPTNHSAHSLLGDIYRDQKKIEDAIRWYRMAIDLHPNASDEAKLAQLDRDHGQRPSRSVEQARSGDAIDGSEDRGLDEGEDILLGLSPRRWLNLLTIVSIGFSIVMMLILVGLQTTHRQNSPSAGAIRSSENSAPAPNSVQETQPTDNNPVPPWTPAPPPSTGGDAGRTGMPPDIQGSASPAAAPRPQNVEPGGSGYHPLLPAPVNRVTPLKPRETTITPLPGMTSPAQGQQTSPHPDNGTSDPGPVIPSNTQ